MFCFFFYPGVADGDGMPGPQQLPEGSTRSLEAWLEQGMGGLLSPGEEYSLNHLARGRVETGN